MNRALSLKELCDMTQWPKSTVHGLLSSLCEAGVVAQQNHNGHYCLGVRLFELGNAAKAQWNILDLARHHMEKISTTTVIHNLGMFDATVC
jgi:DNA-binding IclR family transcriptional regulator